jgi:hypothetical protein
MRQRRNDPRKDFRVVSGVDGRVPKWPLQPDVTLTAMLETQRDRIASMQVELEGCEDGRSRARIKRSLNKAELECTTLALQIAQAQDAEVELWTELWGMPQAELWEESHAHREVAQYVRWKIRAEQGNLDAGKEARMLSDRLGLNPLALQKLRAEIESADKAEAEGAKRRAATPAKKATSRSRKKPQDPRAFLDAV